MIFCCVSFLVVPSFSKIACFNTDYEFLPDILGDFRDQVAANQHEVAINACAELAFEKDYKFFALGYNGRCRSGPNAKEEYHKKTAVSETKYCPNGIGKDKRIVVYTFGKSPFVRVIHSRPYQSLKSIIYDSRCQSETKNANLNLVNLIDFYRMIFINKNFLSNLD